MCTLFRQDGYIQRLTAAMDELFVRNNGVHPELVADAHLHLFKRVGTSPLCVITLCVSSRSLQAWTTFEMVIRLVGLHAAVVFAFSYIHYTSRSVLEHLIEESFFFPARLYVCHSHVPLRITIVYSSQLFNAIQQEGTVCFSRSPGLLSPSRV